MRLEIPLKTLEAGILFYLIKKKLNCKHGFKKNIKINNILKNNFMVVYLNVMVERNVYVYKRLNQQ